MAVTKKQLDIITQFAVRNMSISSTYLIYNFIKRKKIMKKLLTIQKNNELS